jgi:hypothetical protein
MSISSERRKSRAGTAPIVPKSRRTERRPVEAAMLHAHPSKVKATKVPRRTFLHLAGVLPLSRVSRGSQKRRPIRRGQ